MFMTMLSLCTAFVAFFPVPSCGGVIQRWCISVELPLCKGVLNTTYTTPLTRKEQDLLQLEHYRALINVDCSKFAQLFICTSHLPFCSPLHQDLEALQPCRSLCTYVYKSCYTYCILANLLWPKHLNCSLFPRHTSLCIKPSFPTTVSPSTLHSFKLSTTAPSPTTPSQTTPSPQKKSTTHTAVKRKNPTPLPVFAASNFVRV